MTDEENESGRILAMDLGRVRIGVAVSDPLGLTAQPVEIIEAQSPKQAFRRIRKLVERYNPVTFVLGLPVNMDGTEGEQATWVREFADTLARKIPGPEIVFWDERLTSVASESILAESGVKGRKRKQYRDKIAATLILQAYLESRRFRAGKAEEAEE